MDKIGLTEVRAVLSEVLIGYTGICEDIARTPDNKFLKANLHDVYGLTSLDFEDMFDELYNLYGISVDIYSHHPLTQYSFENEPTVENFIETVNYCLSIEK